MSARAGSSPAAHSSAFETPSPSRSAAGSLPRHVAPSQSALEEPPPPPQPDARNSSDATSQAARRESARVIRILRRSERRIRASAAPTAEVTFRSVKGIRRAGVRRCETRRPGETSTVRAKRAPSSEHPREDRMSGARDRRRVPLVAERTYTSGRSGAREDGDLSLRLRDLKSYLPPTAVQMARGLQTCLPGARRSWGSTGGTDDAPYCYEVFLKHLTLCAEAGMSDIARVRGGDRARRLDRHRPRRARRGQRALLRARRRPVLARGSQPADTRRAHRLLQGAPSEPVMGMAELRSPPGRRLLPEPDPRRGGAAQEPRARAARRHPRRARRRRGAERIRIGYHCPWMDDATIEPGSVDWIYSQSVMEHVDDVEGAYAAMYRWLRPGGFVSHQIDLRSHELFPEWNGHWGVPRWRWRVIRGRRVYLINRLPCERARARDPPILRRAHRAHAPRSRAASRSGGSARRSTTSTIATGAPPATSSSP